MVWNLCNKWVGISSVQHNQLNMHFQQFSLMALNSKENKIWKGLWISIIWNIWNHRNKIVFKQGKVDPEEIFTLIHLNAWAWMKYKVPHVHFSYNDWNLYPIECIKSIT